MIKKNKLLISISIICFMIGILLVYLNIERILFPDSKRINQEFRNNVKYAIFGQLEGNRNVILLEDYQLDDIINSIQFFEEGATACGFDYFFKLNRSEAHNINISINTECKYFNVDIQNDLLNLGAGCFFSLKGKFNKLINQLILNLKESKKYLYQFRVPVNEKFNDLKEKLSKNDKFIVMEPDTKEEERNSFILAKYTDCLNNYPELNETDISKNLKFGEIRPDERFKYFFQNEKLKNKIISNEIVLKEMVYQGKTKVNFIREIKIFVKDLISNDAKEYLKNNWEKLDKENSFEYIQSADYTIDVITDCILSEDQINELILKYCLKKIY